MRLPWSKAVRAPRPEPSGLPTRVRRIRMRISRIFRRRAGSSPSPILFPEVDLYESPGEIVVHVETHDLDARDIQIRLRGNVLRLAGSPGTEDAGATRSPAAVFRRSVVLPGNIVRSGIKARYHAKRLVIRIPRDATNADPSSLDRAVKL